MTHALPIDAYLSQITETVRRETNLVLVAEPGAGKTTRVPSALLAGGIAAEARILVLQPRRVAARATARRVAEEQGQAVGQEVGESLHCRRACVGLRACEALYGATNRAGFRSIPDDR